MDPRALLQVLGISGLGVLGMFDPQGGGLGAAGLLAWLGLLSVPAGIFAAWRDVRFWPYGLFVPAIWSFLMIFCGLSGGASLPAPLGGMAAVGGLYGLGFGVGSLIQKHALRAAAIALLSMLLLVGAAQGGGLAQPDAVLARHQPDLARLLVNASPLVFVYECAGVDWTHANPAVYAQSGVEWFPRSAYDGRRAGLGALLLGALFAFLADRRRNIRAASIRG
jgi:hypothetical protein